MSVEGTFTCPYCHAEYDAAEDDQYADQLRCECGKEFGIECTHAELTFKTFEIEQESCDGK